MGSEANSPLFLPSVCGSKAIRELRRGYSRWAFGSEGGADAPASARAWCRVRTPHGVTAAPSAATSNQANGTRVFICAEASQSLSHSRLTFCQNRDQLQDNILSEHVQCLTSPHSSTSSKRSYDRRRMAPADFASASPRHEPNLVEAEAITPY